MTEKKKIFVVGNSRSGTTMLARVLGNHPDVHSFDELHFFESLVDADVVLRRPDWSEQRLLNLAERLLTRSREGFFARFSSGRYRVAAREVCSRARGEDPLSVYEAFLDYECSQNGKGIPCEQTPRYIYAAGEILDAFPEARVINLVRDPRAVMLSQKNKWRRRRLGGASIPRRESVRSWVNYHPYLIARLWNSAVSAADACESRDGFLTVRFEEIVSGPQQAVERICGFVGISFSPTMLEVPRIGSSIGADLPDAIGIDSERAISWRGGGLSNTEIDICQRVCGEQMERWGYALERVTVPFWRRGLRMTMFPIQVTVAFMLNLGRAQNIVATLRRRLFPERIAP